jgi:hypothetical protein
VVEALEGCGEQPASSVSWCVNPPLAVAPPCRRGYILSDAAGRHAGCQESRTWARSIYMALVHRTKGRQEEGRGTRDEERRRLRWSAMSRLSRRPSHEGGIAWRARACHVRGIALGKHAGVADASDVTWPLAPALVAKGPGRGRSAATWVGGRALSGSEQRRHAIVAKKPCLHLLGHARVFTPCPCRACAILHWA